MGGNLRILFVGPSVLAGLLMMILLIPLNLVISRFQKKLELSQMKTKDQRVKMMNEILNGIKVIIHYSRLYYDNRK